MYQVIVKGRNLEELKDAVRNINDELQGGNVAVGMSKDLKEDVKDLQENITPSVEPVVTAPVIDNNAELDCNGLPWDSRIHAKTKTKNADGSWRNRRNLDKDLLAQVESELKGNSQTSPVEEVAQPVANPAAPVAGPAPVAQNVETPSAVAAPAPVAPAPQMNMNGHTVETFSQNYPMVINQLINEQKIDQTYLNQLKEYFGVSEFWELNDQQKEELFNSFVQYGFIEKA